MSQPNSIARGVGAVSLVLASSTSHASVNGFFFGVSNTVSPAEPNATISLWASFDPAWYALAKSHLRISTQSDPGWMSDPEIELGQWYYSDPGQVIPDGDSVADVSIVQYHLLFGQFADTANPIKLWSATWTTDDFTRREVAVRTESNDFWLYTNEEGQWKNFFDIDFSEGLGTIKVVPSPGGVLALTTGALFYATRRRARSHPAKHL